MATKFANNISNGNSALARRANILETQARIAQQAIVDGLKKDKTNLEILIMNMTDFSPESTDSLRPGSINFDADKWAAELQKAKIDLWRINISIQQAEETYKEFFTEVE